MKNKITFLFFFTLFISSSCYNQYYLTDPEYNEDGNLFSGILYFKGEFNPDDYHYDWTHNNTKELLYPIERLNIRISLECDKYLHIYVIDTLKKRWENSMTISETYKKKIKTCSQTKSLKDFGLIISEDMTQPFYLKLINPESNELIFTTENTDFLYSDFFISFAGYITTNDIYGFGERAHELKLGDGKFTMWPNASIGVHPDYGIGGDNSYGAHPIALHKVNNQLFLEGYYSIFQLSPFHQKIPK